MEDNLKKSGLKRGFSLHDAAMFGIGGAIGSGILFAVAGGTTYAGPAIIISWIIAAIMIVIVTIPYAEFSAMAPRGGISARISYYSYGSYGGFMSGWSLFLWAVLIPPIEAVAVSEYASYYIKGLYSSVTGFLTPEGIALSIALTILFVFINLFGIRKFGIVNNVLTWFKILVVVAIIVIVPLFVFRPSNFTTPSFIPSNASGILIAIPATGILFSFGGYRQVADMAGEIKNPKRNLPRAIGITLAVQSIFYILMTIIVVGSVNWTGLKTAPGSWSVVGSLGSPIVTIIHSNIAYLHGYAVPVLSGLIILALIFAIFSPMGTFGVYLTGSSRIIFGFSREGAIPSFFGSTTKKGTPLYAIILVAVIGDLFLIPFPSWYTLTDFVVVAAVVNFAIVAASLPVIRKLYPEIERPFKVPFATAWSFVAFIASSILIYFATYPDTLYALGATLAGSVVFIYQAYKKHFQELSIKNSLWIPVYIIVMIIISYLGSSSTGGINLIKYPYDIVSVIIVGIVFWFVSQASAPRSVKGDMESLIKNAPEDV
ncbi:APC family permease [Picrophilus oshimae]|uniref:Amino acid permease n=1 Tax=Picrophilus torridus (strain ATCC 700027 / DSM 9790 / JCM 10055 / NBRC 100828 / KAW 2/3) TaxID=1122961 RepID=Q6L0I4_PICTO|nr:APC family permease [Picrophilus oshimae]AAT43518.1 amino acid permease [Picrophilus oshimae DSM 9789]